jgi:hypothetical protein
VVHSISDTARRLLGRWTDTLQLRRHAYASGMCKSVRYPLCYFQPCKTSNDVYCCLRLAR